MRCSKNQNNIQTSRVSRKIYNNIVRIICLYIELRSHFLTDGVIFLYAPVAQLSEETYRYVLHT